MNAADWKACADPGSMLEAASGRLSGRKLLLFVAGAARRVWNRLPEWAQTAVPLIEQAAESGGPEEIATSLQEVFQTVGGQFMRMPLMAVQTGPDEVARYASRALRTLDQQATPTAERNAFAFLTRLFFTNRQTTDAGQAAILKCVAGYPFDSPTFHPSWQTSDVYLLAAGAYAENEFSALPILADALQDAGCEDTALLDHLRGPGPHARGCWVLDLILGKS